MNKGCKECIWRDKQENPCKVCNDQYDMYMRYTTQEERDSVDQFIKSIYSDTGVNFWNVEKVQKELQELREYKNKVEKFISKYDGNIVLLPGEVVLTWNQCIQKLKEELGYDKVGKG